MMIKKDESMSHVRQNKMPLAFAFGPVLAVIILVGCEQAADSVPQSVLDVTVAIPDNEAADVAPEPSGTEEVFFVSGMDVGTVPLPFEVDDVTGPNKGKTLCYRCLYGGRPVVGVFVRDLDESTKTLIKKIDQEVAAHQDEKLAAFVVVLTDEPESTKPDLEKIAVDNEIKNVPLTVFEGAAGPRGYNIAKEAAVNVMMWVGEVKANRAYPKGQLNEAGIQDVVADARLIVNLP
jgi:hypothetical protein